MTEDFLHFLWKHKLFEQKRYFTNMGDEVQIVSTGEYNKDSGPDFKHAKVRINNTLWAGNVEVHKTASDWLKHGHVTDKTYDSVILHVVLKSDVQIKSSEGRIIPAIELQYNTSYEENYKRLLQSQLWVPCAEEIGQIERFHIVQWLTKLAVERLEERAADIIEHLENSNYHWEEVFYRFLARNFGFKVNALPFEMLARSLPLSVLAKHKNNLHQLEALFFGQSGLLTETEGDGYVDSLRNEYKFLQKKYQLKPIEGHIWKFARLRPFNFPTVRIAQFVSLIHKSSGLFSKIIEAPNVESLLVLFQASPSSYWNNHFRFQMNSPVKTKSITKETTELIILNTIVPFLFVYGKNKNLPLINEKALTFMEELKPENNAIIENWLRLGIEPHNAFETQALIQLKNRYCTYRRCLECAVGNRIISNKE